MIKAMKNKKKQPILTIEGEFQGDKNGRRLKHYDRQIQALRARLRKRLDQGLPKERAAPFLSLMEACTTASSVLSEVWREFSVGNSR